MREEFFIERQGKRFVLYAGLLEEAHERGLKSISTALLHFEMDGAAPVCAIVKAEVVMEDGTSYQGIGDATRENVSRNIAPHLIRQAETRAKARALRDAVNIGITAFEETHEASPNTASPGTEHGESPLAQARDQRKDQRPRSNSAASGSPVSGAGGNADAAGSPDRKEAKGDLPATRKQLDYLEKIIPDVSENGIAGFEDYMGKKLGEITREEASEWIGRLTGKAS